MFQDPKLDHIPKGNTSRGVHQTIVEYLLETGESFDGKAMLDIPCGTGSLTSTLRRFFPNANLRGCDLENPSNLTSENFCVTDANNSFTIFPKTSFACIFSISDIMEFDNTLQFCIPCHNHLQNDGLFFVTNDNVIGIRDRLSYFWFGKPKQYSLFVTPQQPTWKIIPLSNMVRIVQDAGFHIREIRYVPIRRKDWLGLP